MFELKGIIPPLVTPFDEGGAVLYDAFQNNLERYLEAGIQGYLVLGSTGESVYLEHSEKLKLIEAARKGIPDSMTLLAGTGLESTAATIELTRQASDRGVDGVLVSNPFYYRGIMKSDVYLAHYAAVADASPVPVVVYNVPMFTGISMDARLLAELSRHPNIRGLKESSGDPVLVSEVISNTEPDTYAVVVGSAPTLLANMTAGASGGIVAMADASPKAMLELYRSFAAGDYKRAAEVQRASLLPAIAVTSRYGIPGLKAAMELLGFRPGWPRRPLLPLKQPQREEIAGLFRKMNSELAK